MKEYSFDGVPKTPEWYKRMELTKKAHFYTKDELMEMYKNKITIKRPKV